MQRFLTKAYESHIACLGGCPEFKVPAIPEEEIQLHLDAMEDRVALGEENERSPLVIQSHEVPTVRAVLVGSYSLDHVVETLRAQWEKKLSDEWNVSIEMIVAEPPFRTENDVECKGYCCSQITGIPKKESRS